MDSLREAIQRESMMKGLDQAFASAERLSSSVVDGRTNSGLGSVDGDGTHHVANTHTNENITERNRHSVWHDRKFAARRTHQWSDETEGAAVDRDARTPNRRRALTARVRNRRHEQIDPC